MLIECRGIPGSVVTLVVRPLPALALVLPLLASGLAGATPLFPGTLTRVSVATDGTSADSWVFNPSISGNGRIVAFQTDATTLVPGDTNGFPDIFLRDRLYGLTIRVSVGSEGQQANRESFWPDLSQDGRRVAFTSGASNLVPGDTDQRRDIFVHDPVTGTTLLVSTGAANDAILPSISADGARVAYQDGIAGGVRVWDGPTGTDRFVSGFGQEPRLSPDGRFVAFWDWGVGVPGKPWIYLHDLDRDVTDLFVLGCMGACFRPVLSQDASVVAFLDFGPSSETVVAVDRTTGLFQALPLSQEGYNRIDVTPNGRFVAFDSSSGILAGGILTPLPGAYLWDRATGELHHVSGSDASLPDGLWGNNPVASDDGRHVAFETGYAHEPADTNNRFDIYVRDRLG